MATEIGSGDARPETAEGAGGKPNPRWQRRGPALCLSGGGFRATLFHLGSLRRLNELGALANIDTITSVSGGSITNGVLATRWSSLSPGAGGAFTNFEKEVAAPIRAFCARDLRTPLLLWSRIDPANWGQLIRAYFAISGNVLAEAYEPFFRAKLSDTPRPGPGVPRFVFCATNVATGACWHFHAGAEARMGDHYAGYCDARWVKVSEAVAASSAFPFAFSALRLKLAEGCELDRVDQWGERREVSEKRGAQPHGSSRMVLLTDGGVYDNLGVEPVWKNYETLLVSDAGRLTDSVLKTSQLPLPRLRRAANIGIEQVGTIRRRWLFEQLDSKDRKGAIWAIHTQGQKFPLHDKQHYTEPVRLVLNKVRTDLNAFTATEMACLENQGYCLADGAVRSYVPQLCSNPTAPFCWPNQDWVEEAKVLNGLRKSGSPNILSDIWGQITGRT